MGVFKVKMMICVSWFLIRADSWIIAMWTKTSRRGQKHTFLLLAMVLPMAANECLSTCPHKSHWCFAMNAQAFCLPAVGSKKTHRYIADFDCPVAMYRMCRKKVVRSKSVCNSQNLFRKLDWLVCLLWQCTSEYKAMHWIVIFWTFRHSLSNFTAVEESLSSG